MDTVDSHDLESICHQVLDMYSEKSAEEVVRFDLTYMSSECG